MRKTDMTERLSAETRMWRRLADFTRQAEYALCTGASLADAEELLFGWQPNGNLPACFACLASSLVVVPAMHES